MDRQGVCLACHREISDRSLAVSLLHHVAKTAGMLPNTDTEHSDLVRKNLLLAGRVQVLGILGGPLVGGLMLLLWWRRRRARAAGPRTHRSNRQ